MGLVTSISGGAGVFAVPIMLALGVPPINTLALNKTSDFGVSLGALRNYKKAKSIDWKLGLVAAIPVGIGSFVGATFVVALPLDVLHWIILAGIIVGIFFLLKPIHPKETHKREMTVLGWVMLFLVGVWSGGLGMAGATFAVLVLVYFFGKDFLIARSTHVVAAIPETVISASVLLLSSSVSVSEFAPMFVSSFLGAWCGSHLAVAHGSQFIRIAMVAVAVAMVVKLLFFS